jgi:hypothetical protein
LIRNDPLAQFSAPASDDEGGWWILKSGLLAVIEAVKSRSGEP